MTTTASQGLAHQELDGLLLADTLRAGIYRLFRHTDHINKINVFPVPDGDTGTNMSMTLSSFVTYFSK
jgi:dihydroxyacetone kinase-like predicted kinase